MTRDLYIPADEVGFWQGAIRDRDDPVGTKRRAAIEERRRITIDLLYGDYEGGQHTISRFALLPLRRRPVVGAGRPATGTSIGTTRGDADRSAEMRD